MTARRALSPIRIVRAPKAADYACFPSVREFLRAVAAGEMPPAFQYYGGDAWDLRDIDDAIDLLKSATKRGHSWQEKGAHRV